MNDNINFHSLQNKAHRYDALLNAIGDAQIVLLGESTHGTEEFYKTRMEISQELITKKGFNIITLEADWPDTYRINRYIQHISNDNNAIKSLIDFKRFPSWMWRNETMVTFIEWLRSFNCTEDLLSKKVHIYGLDVYSLIESIKIIITELEKIDLKMAELARIRYRCFETYDNPQDYGFATSLFPNKSCEDDAIALLKAIRETALENFAYDDLDPAQTKFYLEQNARIVKNAEEYYRSLFSKATDSS